MLPLYLCGSAAERVGGLVGFKPFFKARLLTLFSCYIPSPAPQFLSTLWVHLIQLSVCFWISDKLQPLVYEWLNSHSYVREVWCQVSVVAAGYRNPLSTRQISWSCCPFGYFGTCSTSGVGKGDISTRLGTRQALAANSGRGSIQMLYLSKSPALKILLK